MADVEFSTRLAAKTTLPSAVTTGDYVPVVRSGVMYKATSDLLPVGPQGDTGDTGATGPASTSIESNVQTASYVLVLADAGKAVRMNVASANTLTIPPNSSVAFDTDTVIVVQQYGAGTTTLTAGVGVTLRSRGGFLELNGQYAIAALHKIGTNEWMVSGDLV